MKTRVTITLEPEVHLRAKRLARRRKTSVSGLLESLVEEAETETLVSKVDGLIGCATAREAGDADDHRIAHLRSKYLK